MRLFELIAFFVMVGISRILRAEQPGSEIELDFDLRSRATTPLASGGGSASRWSSSADLSLPLVGSTWMGFGLDVYTEADRFNFSDFPSFIAGRSSPISRAFDFFLQPSLLLTPQSRWGFVFSPMLEYSGAEQTNLKNSRLWSGSAAAFCQLSTTIKLGLGLTIAQRMSGGALVLPFPVIDWQLARRWNLTALDGESGRLAFRATANLQLYGEAGFKSREIRLAPASSIPGGILRVEEFPILLGIEYRIPKHVSLRAGIGKAAAQTLRFEDNRGRLLRVSAVHAPGLASLEADFTF